MPSFVQRYVVGGRAKDVKEKNASSRIAAGRQAREGAEFGQIDADPTRAVGAVELEIRHRRLRAEDQERIGRGYDGFDHPLGLGHDRAPVVVPRCDERSRDHPSTVGVERGHADDLVAHDVEARHSVDALDQHRARAGSADRSSGRRRGSSRARGAAATSGRPATRRHSPRRSCRAVRPTAARPDANGRPDDASRPCASTPGLLPEHSSDPDSGCRRTPIHRASMPRTRPACSGSPPEGCRRYSTFSTRNVLRSSPPVEMPYAMNLPSGDGWYQSSAAVGSPVSLWGSTSVRAMPGALRGPDHEDGLIVMTPSLDRENPVAGDGARDGRSDAQQ